MKKDFYDEFLGLINSLKTYINLELPASSSVIANEENYNYFKILSQNNAQKKPLPSKEIKEVKIDNSQIRQAPIYSSQLAENHKKQHGTPLPDVPESSKKPVAEKNNPQPSVKRENLEPDPQIDFSELKKIWQNLFPHTPLLQAIPSDEQAKKINSRWQHPAAIPGVVLLYFNENPQEKTFLTNVATAITQHLVPAGLISAVKLESEKDWSNFLKQSSLRLIIAPHHHLNTLPQLAEFYHEDSARGNHTLGNIPLLLLADISLYLQEPKLKLALWQTLRQRLSGQKSLRPVHCKESQYPGKTSPKPIV